MWFLTDVLQGQRVRDDPSVVTGGPFLGQKIPTPTSLLFSHGYLLETLRVFGIGWEEFCPAYLLEAIMLVNIAKASCQIWDAWVLISTHCTSVALSVK